MFTKQFETNKTIVVNGKEVSFNKVILKDGCIFDLSSKDPLVNAMKILEQEHNFSGQYNSGEKFDFYLDNELVASVQTLSVDIYGKISNDWDIPMTASAFWDNVSFENMIEPSKWFSPTEAIVA